MEQEEKTWKRKGEENLKRGGGEKKFKEKKEELKRGCEAEKRRRN